MKAPLHLGCHGLVFYEFLLLFYESDKSRTEFVTDCRLGNQRRMNRNARQKGQCVRAWT